MTPRIRTFTGLDVNPLDLHPGNIRIEDIAHHLALTNRFAGGTKYPISVAQHSVWVYRLCSHTIFDHQALLHDGAEAYLGDVTKWIKQTPDMKKYREAEDRAQSAIFQKFGCPLKLDPIVEWADRVMVRFEGQQGYGPSFSIDHPNYPPLRQEELNRLKGWEFWTWQESERIFLETAEDIGLMG